MSYNLEFHPKALKEWHKLGDTIKAEFKKKLQHILQNPKTPKNKLRGYSDIYKIKLSDKGYRLAYKVVDTRLVVYVVAVGKRENNAIYNKLSQRED